MSVSRLLFLSAVYLLVHLSQADKVRAPEPRLRMRGACDSVCKGFSCGVANREPRVVGGRATQQYEYPWLASLRYRGKLYCGASLVNEYYLITAAHCIKRVTMSRVEIILGGYNKSDTTEASRTVRGVGQWWAHKQFNRRSYNNDIGVIKLDKPVTFSQNLRPVCLPAMDETDTYVGKNGIVAGWGRQSEDGEPSQILRQVFVPIISNAECKTKKYKPDEITDNMMCAGYDAGKIDACQGDSGGPLLYQNLQKKGTVEIIGIVSWGQGCARPGYPGVYTRLSKYWDFINSHIKDEGCFCPSL